MKFKNCLGWIKYDTRDLYEWAVKHNVQDCDIEIQYRDAEAIMKELPIHVLMM